MASKTYVNVALDELTDEEREAYENVVKKNKDALSIELWYRTLIGSGYELVCFVRKHDRSEDVDYIDVYNLN